MSRHTLVDDAIEPRPQRRSALETLEAPPSAEQCLLHGVLGLERRSQHPVGVGGQLHPMLLQPELQLLEPARLRALSYVVLLRRQLGQPRSLLSANQPTLYDGRRTRNSSGTIDESCGASPSKQE